MRIILQRVTEASVTTINDGKIVSSIGKGILMLLGLTETDTEEIISKYVGKCLKARLWSEIPAKELEEETKGDKEEKSANARWRTNVMDNDYEIIVVSQFTLYGSLKYGHKPQFDKAMSAEKAKLLYELFIAKMKEQYKPEKVFGGAFQQHMNVKILNDGPVTLILEEEIEQKSQEKQEKNLQKLAKQKEIQQKTEENKRLKKEKEDFKKWLKEKELKYESKEQYQEFLQKFREENQQQQQVAQIEQKQKD